jgi:putative membrane protein
VITPAAVVTIASGAALVFLREVFTGWVLAKFVLVAGLVAVHAWVGHTITAVAEERHVPPGPLLPTLIVSGLVIGILCLVLAKPELEEITFPAWMLSPLGRQLPFDVPSR